MARIKIGDVFEISTPKGKAYLQYVYKHETIGELIRILDGLYVDGCERLDELVENKELYFIHFPLGAAYKRRIVNKIGNYLLPTNFKLPRKFRDDHIVRGEFICWHIVDYDSWQRESVKELSEEQKKLSPLGTWNDTLLIEKLVDDWTLDEWS